jgi:hypothetical protein
MRYGPVAGLLSAALLLHPRSIPGQNAVARTRLSVSGGMAWYSGSGDAYGAYGVQGGLSVLWQERPTAMAVQLDARGYSLGFGRADFGDGLIRPNMPSTPPRGLVALEVGVLTPTAGIPLGARVGAGFYVPTDQAVTNSSVHFGLEAALRFPVSPPGRGVYIEAGYTLLYNGIGQRGSLVPVSIGYTF